MAERGYLSPAWAFHTEICAWWWERFCALRERLAEVEDKTDKNLSIRVAEASREFSARLAKLGLTPTDASKVAIPLPEDGGDAELERLLGFDPDRAH